jgi:hypothetical protein
VSFKYSIHLLSVQNPDSIRSVDPDSVSGSRRVPTKIEKSSEISFEVWYPVGTGCSLLRAEGSLVAWASFMEA